MPGMQGGDVCKRLKSDVRTKDIPVLFLTSTNTSKDIIEHYDLGAEVHLTKPINPKELISQIEITFGRK
jgi:CheY-like chemotaxis protein